MYCAVVTRWECWDGDNGELQSGWADELMHCSYNKFNGTWACENGSLMNKLLKEEMGFKGYIMSDWNGELRCRQAKQWF